MPGFDADDEANRPPPHPLDRPWIHPSELGASRRGGAAQRPVASSPRPRRARSWRRDAILALSAGAMGALATVSILALAGAFDSRPARVVRAAAAPLTTDAAAVAARIAPGIAAVTTTAVAGAETRGSGVIVGPHELITTTDVVSGTGAGATVSVALQAGHPHAATVRATDPVTDLVLLEVPDVRLEPLQLGAPAPVRAGDWVVAVGRTSNHGPWVTSGVVTGTGGWLEDAEGVSHAGLITTNTAVTDDARGGALVDGRGHVVGILATVDATSAHAAAMPADLADDVVSQLTDRGRASHGALGISVIDSAAGPVVAAVSAGSCAERAGILVEDRVVSVGDVATPDTATLVYELRLREAASRTTVEVERGTHRLRLDAVLDDAAELPRRPGAATALALATGP